VHIAAWEQANPRWTRLRNIPSPYLCETGTCLDVNARNDAVKFCESRDTPLIQWGRSICLALAYHAAGRQSDAKRELEEFRSIDKERSPKRYAAIYAFWGDKAAALYWLHKSEQQRDSAVLDIKYDWEFEPIRKEPEFIEFEGQLKIPQ
jgi:hypothetical protein